MGQDSVNNLELKKNGECWTAIIWSFFHSDGGGKCRKAGNSMIWVIKAYHICGVSLLRIVTEVLAQGCVKEGDWATARLPQAGRGVTRQVSLQLTCSWSRQWDHVLLVSCRVWLLLSPVTVTPVLSGRWSWHKFIQSINVPWAPTWCQHCARHLLCGCTSLSGVRLFETTWTAACHASLSFAISLSLLNLMSTE